MKTIKIALLIILLALGDNLFAQTTKPIILKDTTTQEYPISKHGTPGIPTGKTHIDDHGTSYPILRGPRGGEYYITKNNTKRYIRH